MNKDSCERKGTLKQTTEHNKIVTYANVKAIKIKEQANLHLLRLGHMPIHQLKTCYSLILMKIQ